MRKPPATSRLFLGLVLAVIALGVIVVVWWWPEPASNSSPTNNASANGSTGNDNTNVTATNAVNAKPDAVPDLAKTYSDDEFGFSLRYPESWSVEVNDNNEDPENRIVNYVFGSDDTGVTLIVVPTAMEGIVRESISIERETEAVINGQAARVIDATSAKDGTAVRLIFFTKNATLFVLNGAPQTVDRIGATFTL